MIVAVVQEDDTVIGDGRAGRHTQIMLNALRIQIGKHYKKQTI